MEDVVEQYRRLALEKENSRLNFDDEEDEATVPHVKVAEFPVVGVINTDRKVRFQAVQELFTSLWRPGRGMAVQEIDEKRYLFTFNHKIDMNRVIEDGPWLFERNLVLLKAVGPNDIPHKMDLFEAEFWVQVHNVPYKFMNVDTARRVGNYIGEFISFDESHFKEKWSPYLRIRVKMDVRKPLKKGSTLTKGGEGHWVDFKYEKLPSFCFICGIMGHSEKFCPLKYVEDLVLETNFSAELRAGGGGKISPTRGGKGLMDKHGGPSHHRRTQQDDEGTRRHGSKGRTTETESSGTKEENRSGAGEVSVDQKRRRVWKDPAEENNSEEEMALDNTKNGEEAGLSS
ncbi:unnamed protein product [Cuscuta epithymum]|uniref:CCHC-type domain-containing protein n=1 Tax=Cuscuta epithymum TaxID=186058 RepID=A0AAV0G729_9ASTE|nr:unnamed protein product [Cuscuta epithymum]